MIKPPLNNFPTLKIGKELQNCFASLSAFTSELETICKPFLVYGKIFAELEKKRQILDESGWFPHASLPIEIIDFYKDDILELKNELEIYYTENQTSVTEDSLKNIRKLDVTDNFKLSFAQALELHTNGYYKAVPRLIFPELEQLWRVTFLNGKIENTITSQKDLRENSGELYTEQVITDKKLGFIAFDILQDHLYKKIKTEEDLSYFTSNPIPNRHAVIHGFINYDTMQNSLNTIFIAEYLAHIISEISKSDFIKIEKN